MGLKRSGGICMCGGKTGSIYPSEDSITEEEKEFVIERLGNNNDKTRSNDKVWECKAWR